MSPCEREEVGSEGHHVQDLKSSVIQHFLSHAGDDGAHGSSMPFHRRSICEGCELDDGKVSGLMSRSRESSSALIDLGQGTAVATSHGLHAKIMLPADARLPVLFRRTC
jgi:hypothetical protein